MTPTTICRIAVVFGTRPEAIKLAPVIQQLQAAAAVEPVLIATAQHRALLDQAVALFQLRPDYDLDIMQPRQTLFEVVRRVLAKLPPILAEVAPDWVLVQGDTTTAFAATLAASYLQLPVAHVEAGLRTYDKTHPFPEEINRHLVSVLADLHFAPTESARQNLLREGISDAQIHVTGNSVVDALQSILRRTEPVLPEPVREALACGKRLLLVTAHRRENWGPPLRRICRALTEIVADNRDVVVAFAVHPNPAVQSVAQAELRHQHDIHLLPPLDYATFIHLMSRATLILTDSGGIQEEAPSLGIPVLVLREVTERPEGVVAGVLRVTGTRTEQIVQTANGLLQSEDAYRSMSGAQNPYGDGRAAERIVRILRESEPCRAKRAKAKE